MIQQNAASQLRVVAKLPVSHLASLIGVSRQAYHKWLRGGAIASEHQTRLQEMLVLYRMKGWLRSVEPLAWGIPHRNYEEQAEELDQLSPRPVAFIPGAIEIEQNEAYWACGFDFQEERAEMGVGMPTTLLLDEFGYLVWSAFGHYPYHVGSSVMNKTWRDVDVRLILEDAEYAIIGLGDPKHPHMNKKWVALTLAFSALGKTMTGLPIDFQIQQQTEANATYSQSDGCVRSALGCVARIRQGEIKPTEETTS